MKGLLYKDFLVLRKSFWTFLVLIVIFCLVPNDSFFNLGIFFVVYTALLPASLLSLDERCHWDRLAPMLPVTRRDLVRSKYVMGWYLTLAAGTLFFLGRTCFAHTAPEKAMVQALTAVTAALIFQAILFPILFRLGVEKGRLAMYILMGAAVGITVGAGKTETLYNASSEYALLKSPAPVFFALAVVLTLFSIRVSEGQYGKRER